MISAIKNSLAKHPLAITYLFLTEMWERFSYYGVTAILILYMDKTLAVDKTQIYAIYGAYGALICMTPLLGGLLADKVLGSYRTVILGCLLIALGHFVVAIRDQQFFYFYLGLAIIIVGTGLFSPNINAIVGHLYQPDDSRRDSGFTLAYMGRNIGTIVAPIVCAWLAAAYDWRFAFIVAGLGMLFGLWTFCRGRSSYDARSFNYERQTWAQYFVIGLLVVGLVIAIDIMMLHVAWVGALLLSTVMLMLVVLSFIAYRGKAVERQGIIAATLLTAFYVVFMILLQQSGGALNLFTEGFVDRRFLGYTIETGMFQSVEPLALVLLSPLYNFLWDKLAEKNIQISDGVKFIVALLVMSSSFVVMALAMFSVNRQGLIAMSWINVTYLLQAASELFIGPIGLAMISRIIPHKILGLYMGFWVLASAVANFIAAKIGALMTPSAALLANAGVQGSIALYQHAFWQLAMLGGAAALGLALLLPTLGAHSIGEKSV